MVLDPPADEVGARIDWSSWYLTDEEDMGESGEQDQIIWAIRSALMELSRERGWDRVYIGADQFFAWLEHEPLVRVSPDVYLLDGQFPPPLPAMWETWRPEHPAPRWALEIVSGERWAKDYHQNPPKYAQLGVRELIVFDPEAAVGTTSNPERVPLQLFRREDDGTFVREHGGEGPVFSRELDVWVVVRHEGAAARLALSRDSKGLDLVPTVEEARDQAQQTRDVTRAALEDTERKLAAALAELDRVKRTSK